RDKKFGFDMRGDPVLSRGEIGFVVGNLLVVQELTEILEDCVVYLEVFGDVPADQVMLGEVEESVVLQEFILEASGFRSGNLHIRSDSSSTIDRASAVSQLDFLTCSRSLLIVMVVVVVVQRNSVVIAL